MKYADGTQIILDGENRYKEAAFIEGPNGKLFKGFKSDIPDLDKKLAEFPEPEPQVTDFIEAVKERKKFALNEVISPSVTINNHKNYGVAFEEIKNDFIDQIDFLNFFGAKVVGGAEIGNSIHSIYDKPLNERKSASDKI